MSLPVRPASADAPDVTGPAVASTRCAVSSLNFARVSVTSRCFGPVASAVIYGRLMLVEVTPDSSILAFSAASFKSLHGDLVAADRSTPSVRLELADQVHFMTHSSKSSPPRRVLPAGGQNLDDAVADVQDGDIERAAAEVVDHDLLARLPCRRRRPAQPRPSAR